MNFGEKIFKLRKGKRIIARGFSRTNWKRLDKRLVNGKIIKDFPETEKLLQLSNIFEVSTDFLLKEEKSVKDAAEERGGYYVSKELAKGYIANQKRHKPLYQHRFYGICIGRYTLYDVPCRHYLALFRHGYLRRCRNYLYCSWDIF